MVEIDKSKFPLIGIAKFLEEETEDSSKGRRMAKRILHRTIEKSQVATEEDKNVAKLELEKLEGRMRDSSSNKLSQEICMKSPNDLQPLEGLEEVYINSTDYSLMKENVKEHGIRVPFIITKDNEIICGRQRWTVAKELGLEEVPTILSSEDKMPEIIRIAISDNVCRRQMTQEDRIHYVKLLRELGKSKKGPGRPCKTTVCSVLPEETLMIPLTSTQKLTKALGASTRKLAKTLGVDHSTIVRDIQKIEGKKVNKEYEDIDKKFHITLGRSEEDDRNFTPSIVEWLMNISLEVEKGDTIDVNVKIRVGRKAK